MLGGDCEFCSYSVGTKGRLGVDHVRHLSAALEADANANHSPIGQVFMNDIKDLESMT